MQRSNFGCGIAGLLGLALLVASGQGAMAMPKESGDYDCSCKGGSGSCTFKSRSTSVSCYKGGGNTCTRQVRAVDDARIWLGHQGIGQERADLKRWRAGVLAPLTSNIRNCQLKAWEEIMQRLNIGVVAMAVALAATLLPLQGARARPNNVGGHYNCYCEGGNGGTCSTTNSGGSATCQKGSGDSCTGTCKMVTFTPSADAIMHGGGGSAGGTSPGKAR
jgi:hypothetical protein